MKWRRWVQRFPLCWRATLRQEQEFRRSQLAAFEKRRETELVDAKKAAADMLALFVRIEPRRREFGWSLTTALDDGLMREIAAFDERYWRYIAEEIGRKVERELKTMNFSGFARNAIRADAERRYYPTARSGGFSL